MERGSDNLAEKIGYELDVGVAQASRDIDVIQNKLDRLGRTGAQNNNIVSQKQLVNAGKDIRDAQIKIDGLHKSMNQMSSVKGLDTSGFREANREVKELERSLANVKKSMATTMAPMSVKMNSNFDNNTYRPGASPGKYDFNQYGSKPGANERREVASQSNQVKTQISQARKYSRQATEHGQMNTKEYEYSQSTQRSLQNSVNRIPQNREQIADLRATAKQNAARMYDIKQQPATKKSTGQFNAIERENKQIASTIANLESFGQTLEQARSALTELSSASKQIKKVTRTTDDSSLGGMVSRRSAAIAMGTTAAVGGAIVSKWSQGNSIKDAERPDNDYIGQQTGSYDSVRNRTDAEKLGRSDGTSRKGSEVLASESSYINSYGYTSKNDMEAGSTRIGMFGRAQGVTQGASTEFAQTVGSVTSGANSDSLKNVQQAFAGALKSSGMVGQAKEQLSALNSIVTSVGSGRDLTTAQTESYAGIQGSMGKSGLKSLQGDQGAQVLTSMDSGIKDTSNTKMQDALRLYDPNKYNSSVKGVNAILGEQNKGVLGAGLGAAMNKADAQGLGRGQGLDDVRRKSVNDTLGSEVFKNNESFNYMQDLQKNGQIGKTLSKSQRKDLKDLGNSDSDIKKLEGQQGSDSAKSDDLAAANEKLATGTADLTNSLKGTQAFLIGSNVGVGLLTVATETLTAAMAAVAASGGLNNVLQEATSTSPEGKGEGKGKKYTATKNAKGDSGSSKALKDKKVSINRSGSSTGSKIKATEDGFQKAEKATYTVGKNASKFSKATKFASKIPGVGKFGKLASLVGDTAVVSQGMGMAKTATSAVKGSKFASSLGNLTSKGTSFVSKNAQALKGSKAVSKVGGALSAASKSGVGKFASKGVGMVSKVAGKAAVPIGLAMSASTIMSSKDKTKTAGKEVGGWAGAGAGMAAGASAGAALGTVVPGLGNAVGGVIGGVGGAIAGSGIGSYVGGKAVDGARWLGGKAMGGASWLGEKMFGKKSTKEKEAESKDDQATSEKKDKTEDKRANNIKEEKALIKAYKAMGFSGTEAKTRASNDSSDYSEDSAYKSDAGKDKDKDKKKDDNKSAQSAPLQASIKVTHSGSVNTVGDVNNSLANVNSFFQNSLYGNLPSGNEQKQK